MGNENSRDMNDMVNMFQVDAETQEIINQTPTTRPPLGFHNIRGANVVLQRNGRVARRRESFCKGLAFSNRPVEIDENVCIKLSEVATNWSGVLRFGVTNFDPDTYRNIPVPKFACPDLTTKDGYWAKALPERYSVEGNILHFYVNRAGELFYGINGSQKGIFLSNINTNLPMWLIVDIYGNSVALEFLDASEFRPRRSATQPPSITPAIMPPVHVPPPRIAPTPPSTEDNSSRRSLRMLRNVALQPLRFHRVTGRHITLNSMKDMAVRDSAEYSQGYVFTERPMKNNEKVCVMVSAIEPLYEGGLAFGFTCCDPANLRTTELPDDSSDLIEMPDYWVGIKDIALQPKVDSLLSFWMTESGEVFFEIDTRGPRSVLFVDNTIDLYMYFDVYGATTAIKLLGWCDANATLATGGGATTSSSSSTRSEQHRNFIPLIPVRPARETPVEPMGSGNGLRVNLSRPILTVDEILETINAQTPNIPTHNPTPLTPTFRHPEPPAIPTRPAPIAPPPTCPPPRPPVPAREVTPNSSNDGPENDGECVLCMEAKVNAVLYTCGHMCMCFSCAQKLLETRHPCCPICRAQIRDVIRCFKS